MAEPENKQQASRQAMLERGAELVRQILRQKARYVRAPQNLDERLAYEDAIAAYQEWELKAADRGITADELPTDLADYIIGLTDARREAKAQETQGLKNRFRAFELQQLMCGLPSESTKLDKRPADPTPNFGIPGL